MTLTLDPAPAAPMSAASRRSPAGPDRRRGRTRRRRPRRGRARARSLPDDGARRLALRALLPRRAPDSSAPRPRGRDGVATCSADAWPTRCGRSSSAATDGASPTAPPPARRPSSCPPGARTADAASCFLHLHPGTAPESFARLVSALDGYGVGFRAELAGDPAACLRADSAVVTVRREDAPTVARAALRLQQRAPFALAPSVPAFARQLAPGVATRRRARPADDASAGTAAGWSPQASSRPGRARAAAARRAAVLETLTAAASTPPRST